jgi:hypothetical protein
MMNGTTDIQQHTCVSKAAKQTLHVLYIKLDSKPPRASKHYCSLSTLHPTPSTCLLKKSKQHNNQSGA